MTQKHDTTRNAELPFRFLGASFKKQKLPIFRRRSKSSGVIFTFESSEGEGVREKHDEGIRRMRARGGTALGGGDVESGGNPFIRLSDECRSMGTL